MIHLTDVLIYSLSAVVLGLVILLIIGIAAEHKFSKTAQKQYEIERKKQKPSLQSNPIHGRDDRPNDHSGPASAAARHFLAVVDRNATRLGATRRRSGTGHHRS
jgi:hypothetical protein